MYCVCLFILFTESDVNIMLLGSTGAGKSASGNTILSRARNPFEDDFSPEAVTKVCQSAQTEVDGQTINVIDTVGLSDTSMNITEAQTKIGKIFTHHGIDVFLLVIRLGETFTKNDSKVLKWVLDNFGTKVLKHTIALFTNGDQLHVPVEKYLNKSKTLRSGRYHAFNNVENNDQAQVNELLEKINNSVVEINKGYYTTEMFKKTQRKTFMIKLLKIIGVLTLTYVLYKKGRFWQKLLFSQGFSPEHKELMTKSPCRICMRK
uniref:AIG1-type G domain-containing protein n=1 Tax=Cyprinus carpio TaxID=7962 RepID=A0A8C1IWG4_CYPCA